LAPFSISATTSGRFIVTTLAIGNLNLHYICNDMLSMPS
jgi:hypothetical protein